MNELIYLGIKGRVVALHKESGSKVWETPLKSSSFVNVFYDSDRLFAHTYGELFCLDALDGRILWQDKLEGLGYGYVTFASASAPTHAQIAASLAAIQMEEEQRRSSSSGSNAGTA